MPCAVAPDDFVSRLDVPSHILFGPEHEVEHAFDAPERAAIAARRVHDLRPGTNHEFEFRRRLPRLLEQHVERHFQAAVRRDRRYADLQFEPMFDWRDFERERSPVMNRLAALPVAGRAEFEHDGVIVRFGRRRPAHILSARRR